MCDLNRSLLVRFYNKTKEVIRKRAVLSMRKRMFSHWVNISSAASSLAMMKSNPVVLVVELAFLNMTGFNYVLHCNSPYLHPTRTKVASRLLGFERWLDKVVEHPLWPSLNYYYLSSWTNAFLLFKLRRRFVQSFCFLESFLTKLSRRCEIFDSTLIWDLAFKLKTSSTVIRGSL